MSIRYVYDSKGRKTDVIVPIEIWNKDKSRISKGKKETKKNLILSKYKGIYKDLNIELDKEIKNLRDEWVR